jgi:hypothetical protein
VVRPCGCLYRRCGKAVWWLILVLCIFEVILPFFCRLDIHICQSRQAGILWRVNMLAYPRITPLWIRNSLKAIRPKKTPVVPVLTDPIFFCRPHYFFNAINARATLFSPGGCGLLIQRAKMASVVTLIIEPNCLNSSIGTTHL